MRCECCRQWGYRHRQRGRRTVGSSGHGWPAFRGLSQWTALWCDTRGKEQGQTWCRAKMRLRGAMMGSLPACYTTLVSNFTNIFWLLFSRNYYYNYYYHLVYSAAPIYHLFRVGILIIILLFSSGNLQRRNRREDNMLGFRLPPSAVLHDRPRGGHSLSRLQQQLHRQLVCWPDRTTLDEAHYRRSGWRAQRPAGQGCLRSCEERLESPVGRDVDAERIHGQRDPPLDPNLNR